MAVVINGTSGITTPTESVATTIGVGGATPSASGAGITFPATQSASTNANTLDDYEEGTFTPSVTGSSTNPTVTYGLQTGNYTKIGNTVNFTVQLEVSSMSGGSGDFNVSGLPFASSGGAIYSWPTVYSANWNWGSSKTQVSGRTNPGSSILMFYATQNAGGSFNIPVTNTLSQLYICGFYYV